MLKKLYINNYILIDKLEMEIDSGFTCITGETGAGKSIILGAIGLILGQRAESDVLLNKNEKCIIEAVFEIKNYNLEVFFEKNDIDFDDNTTIRREISSLGKSRAFINDSPVNLSTLKDFVENLIDIHSQFQTLQLQNQNFQTLLLDSFAQNNEEFSDYVEKYNKYTKLEKELREKIQIEAENTKDKDYTQFLFDELNSINIKENELNEIEEEIKLLTNAEAIKSNSYKALDLLSEDENSIRSSLYAVKQTLESLEQLYQPFESLHKRVKEAYIEINDISAEILKNANNIFLDQEKLLLLNERVDSIYSLLQKHKVSTDVELIEIMNKLDCKLQSINSLSEEITKIKKELVTAETELEKSSKILSITRKIASEKMQKIMSELLENLGMKFAIFEVNINKSSEFKNNGNDDIMFLFSANKGHQAKEISKIASGGEMSRLMLSLKSLSIEKKLLPTIIFDEIDSGISGDIALKAGLMMRKMSENRQIIAITHLPQIAGLSDHHFKVYKDEDNNITKSQIKKLSKTQQIDEIAAMISGDETPTTAAVETAKQLLNKK